MNRSSFSRTATLATLVGGLFVSTGSAASYSYSGPGGALVDSDGVNAGFALFDIPVSGTGATVNSIQSVTLTGLSHSFLGDVGIYLFGPDSITYSTIISPPNDDAANLNGTYTFVVDLTKTTIDQAAAGQATGFNILGGTYAISDYGNGVDPGPRSTFNELVGQSLDGVWTLEIDDFAGGETGALTSWGFTADASVAPEPTAIAALGAAGVLFRRRRV